MTCGESSFFVSGSLYIMLSPSSSASTPAPPSLELTPQVVVHSPSSPVDPLRLLAQTEEQGNGLCQRVRGTRSHSICVPCNPPTHDGEDPTRSSSNGKSSSSSLYLEVPKKPKAKRRRRSLADLINFGLQRSREDSESNNGVPGSNNNSFRRKSDSFFIFKTSEEYEDKEQQPKAVAAQNHQVQANEFTFPSFASIRRRSSVDIGPTVASSSHPRRRMSSFPPMEGEEKKEALLTLQKSKAVTNNHPIRPTKTPTSSIPLKLLPSRSKLKWKSTVDVSSSLSMSSSSSYSPPLPILDQRNNVVVFPHRKVEDVPGIFIPNKTHGVISNFSSSNSASSASGSYQISHNLSNIHQRQPTTSYDKAR